MFQKHVLFFYSVLATLILCGGCKTEKEDKSGTPAAEVNSDTTEAVEEDDATSKGSATKPETEPAEEVLSPEEQRKQSLENSYLKLHCLRKSSGPESGMNIYKDAGFETAAAWSSAWHQEAEANPEWASQIVAKAIEKGCKFVNSED